MIAYHCMKPWAGEDFCFDSLPKFPWEQEGQEAMTDEEEKEEEKRILAMIPGIERQLKQRHGKQ